MRVRKASRVLILMAAAPLVFIGVCLLLPLRPPSRPPAPRYVWIEYRGRSNDAGGRVYGLFNVTNPNPFAVECWAFAPAFKTNASGGLQVVPTAMRRHRLKPGHSVEVSIPRPTNNAPWTLVVPAIKPPGAADIIRHYLAWLSAKVRYRIRLVSGDRGAVDFSKHMGSPVAGVQEVRGPLVSE